MILRLLRAVVMLTIFLGLAGSTSLSEPAPLVEKVIQQFQGELVSHTITTEGFSFLIIGLPTKAIEEFRTWGNTTLIRLKNFLMIVESKRVRFEFEPGDLIAHVALFDTQARVVGSQYELFISILPKESFSINVSSGSTYICLKACQERQVEISEGEKISFMAKGVYIVGNFNISIYDYKTEPGNEFFGPMEKDLTIRGTIVIEPHPAEIIRYELSNK